jgi:membrane glycosyltransferase
MVPVPWRGFMPSLRAALRRRLASEHAAAPAPSEPWERAAGRRRNALVALIVFSAALAAWLLTEAQPDYGHPFLRAAQVGLFTLLFAWVSAGFFTAMMGFIVQLRGDRYALSARAVANDPIHESARTAIVMPICNEQVSTVFAGLRATYESLAVTGASRLFDVYVLSDTSDPTLRAAELAAWAELRATLGPDARVYYRWRQRRTRRKAGNVADFCRRWGRNYRYMVVLDADSVMSGDCLLSLVRLMEAHPKAGIIQTAPQACGLATLHARAQQFAGRVTGRLFTAGMQYWQLGESHYWGHNAIIRIEPFMKHCALAPLKGKGGLSGDILSHDFVEAALMRRAGYNVWLVPDLAGSYEQQPPNLLEELQRDRRWCQGNLQNARLIAEPGLHRVHRAMLGTGAMAYVSAPLWLGFVLLGAAVWLFGDYRLFDLETGVPPQVVGLWAATVTMLLLPRVLGIATVVLKREQRAYGGTFALIKGAVIEAALSVWQAPVRMLAHTLFVVGGLTGLKLDWKSPPREAEAVSWGDAARRFTPVLIVVAALMGLTLMVDPGAVLWLAPVAVPLLLAIPLTVLTSQNGFGERIRARGLLVTPEESATPPVLRHAWNYARRAGPMPQWRDVVSDPWLFEVVRSAMGPRNTGRGSRGRASHQLVHRLLTDQAGETITAADRMRLLSEPQLIGRLRAQLAANASFGVFARRAGTQSVRA